MKRSCLFLLMILLLNSCAIRVVALLETEEATKGKTKIEKEDSNEKELPATNTSI